MRHWALTLLTKKRRIKIKIKWIELTEDDPIFKRGFVISSPNIRSFKKEVHNNKKRKEIKTKMPKKKTED